MVAQAVRDVLRICQVLQDQQSDIDYASFEVQVKEVGLVKDTLEKLLRSVTEIQRLQLNLMKNAPYFLYGMGDDSHMYEDAFHKILQSLENYSTTLLHV